MDKITGYVYDAESMVVVAEITGEQAEVERYVGENYDTDTYALTYSPAFGFDNGLIESSDAEIINL